MDAPQPVLIYDGRCRFCAREASRLQRWTRGRMRIESFRDAGVFERYPGLTEAQCEQALQLVEPGGRIRSGADAVACALRLNPRLAPLTWIYYVPVLRRLFDLGYGIVARNRFRLGGEVCTDDTCGVHQPREPPGRRHVRDVFLRLLGVTFLAAFLSLLSQVEVLYGSRGLLPMQQYLDAIRPSATFLSAPTLLWLSCSDIALHIVPAAGAALSLGLVCNVAPGYCLIACWFLYVSFASVGQTFLGFQWDNLLLETAFFALFITPGGWRPRHPPPPHPIAIFMMQWLLFRLHVESGAAKLLSGDPTWRDLTAMVSYYETAPIPTWLGWYVHQMPVWGHKLCALFTFAVELVVPFLMWGPRRLRVVAFFLMVAMQLSVILTGNYGFFNYLSLALCVFVLDDGHLNWAAQWFGRSPTTPASRTFPRWQTLFLSVVAAVLVPFSVILFAPFYRPLANLNQSISPARNVIAPFRSLNIYHLFASMTLVRREVVIEGSNDGTSWQSYEFRYKAGDVDRPPPFVAPHQPRVDFQLWFLLLRGRQPHDMYFNNLLARLFQAPQVVAPLFSRDPFPDTPPKFIRLAFYRYRFTDWATRQATGAWWQRESLGYSKVLTAAAVPL